MSAVPNDASSREPKRGTEIHDGKAGLEVDKERALWDDLTST